MLLSRPPLVWALWEGRAASVASLLRQGADPDAADAHGITARQWAAFLHRPFALEDPYAQEAREKRQEEEQERE